MSDLRIEGGVAVITGAASGIGAGLARHANSLGMRVVLADVDEAALGEVAAGLTDAIVVRTDVADTGAVEALADAAYAKYGEVDLLFNNAGVLATGFSWEIEPARWRKSLDVNIGGVVNGIRAFVPRLVAAKRPARIVNTASVGGFLPSPMMAPYSATKFAVVALTEAHDCEKQMLKSPVGVSLLAPGPVKSAIFGDPFGVDAPPEAERFVDSMRDMLERYGLTPDEFAPRVFDGIRRGDYWLVPQPETLDAQLKARTETILSRRDPQFYLVEGE